MCEMQYTLDGIDSRSEIAEEKMNELDTIAIETIQTETQREKKDFLKRTEWQGVVGQIQIL